MSQWNYVKGYIVLELSNCFSKDYQYAKYKENSLKIFKEIQNLFKYDDKNYRLFNNFSNWYKESNIVPYGSEGSTQVDLSFKETEHNFRIAILIHGNLRDSGEEQAVFIEKWVKKIFNQIEKLQDDYIHYVYSDYCVRVNGKIIKE